MRWNQGLLPLLTCAAALAMAGSARADSITYEFTGTVSNIVDDAANITSSNFSAGDAVSGSFTIDTTGTSDALPGDPTRGIYGGDPATFTLAIGTGSWSGNWSAQVLDDYLAASLLDGFVMSNTYGSEGDISGSSYGGLTAANAVLSGGDSTYSMWSSDSLGELLSLDPSNLTSIGGSLRIDSSSTNFGVIYFGVSTLSSSAVPEPATLTLMSLGAAGLAWTTRRRRQRRPS